MSILRVKDLGVVVDSKKVLNNINLEIKSGEIIAIMGPNGSGKSSLAYTIMGNPKYKIISGEIWIDNENITEAEPYERSLKGILLGFQNPVEIYGVRLSALIIAAKNKRENRESLTRIYDPTIIDDMQKYSEILGLKKELLHRDVNVGFSGGERKRSEMLQILLLNPKFVILDEPDSGLDVEGIKTLSLFIKELSEKGVGVLLITHYARILQYLKPSKVYILINGKIVEEGGPQLAEIVEARGYKVFGGNNNE
ncbi:MAG: Fe-S cluster assembly ATPase SufC [Candidatus Njordarchaeia archaeon]|nr:Fe-S cluster assembly ATPase SufC [Candidatus Korarchaeota archaeon]